jgi:hypothetical protein
MLFIIISAKTLGKSQYANQSVACWLLTLKTFKGENLGVNKANSHGKNLNLIYSLDLKSSRVLGMDNHGSVSINNHMHIVL